MLSYSEREINKNKKILLLKIMGLVKPFTSKHYASVTKFVNLCNTKTRQKSTST